MKRLQVRLLSVPLLITALGAPARAEEPTTPSSTECAAAYEQAQEQRKSGRLAAARDSLRLCARDECPGFIHDDCVSWYTEVQAELPTLVFSATSRGRDLTEVKVAEGERVLATRLEGQVVELDPGEYDLTFSAPDVRPTSLRFVVARGEQNRLVRVELEPLHTTTPPARAPLLAPAPRRSLTTPAIFAGVGLAGLGGFVALGAWGRASEDDLAGSCSPTCTSDQVSDTRTKYILADVSLGIGVASLALAAYTFFRAAPPPAQSGNRVGLQASSGDVRMTYGGRF